MLVVLIMLVNMLIAHLSNVFEEARNEGRIEFSYDKAWMTCKLEQSRFKVRLFLNRGIRFLPNNQPYFKRPVFIFSPTSKNHNTDGLK